MITRNIWRWVVKRFSGALDNIIAMLIFAGIAYIIGVISGWLPGLTIYALVPIPLVVVIVVLLPLLVIVMIVIRRSTKGAKLIKSIKLYESTRPIDLERLGFSRYIECDPLLVDNIHRFLLIQQTYLIEGQDGTFILRYKGKNATRETSRFFRDSIVGDSPADNSLMAIQVVDKTKNVFLKWRLVKDEPYEKLIEIYFWQPLNFGDTFDIELSCRWPGTFTRRDDYVFYPMHYYNRGVDRLVGKLVLNEAPSYVEGARFNGKQLELEPFQPQIQKKRKKFLITWLIDNPMYIYILQYGRQDV